MWPSDIPKRKCQINQIMCQRKEIIMAEIPGLKARNVVLVHGGFVDGSGWEGVYKILTKDGYTVGAVSLDCV